MKPSLPPYLFAERFATYVPASAMCKIVAVTVTAYQLQLPDGTALGYVNDASPRNFRDPYQATKAFLNLGFDASVLTQPAL